MAPIIESLLSNTTLGIIDRAIKAGKYTAKEIRGAYDGVQHEQRVIAASNNYIENYRKRHCQIKIMPGLMTEPRELGTIYTAVKLLDDKSRRAFLGPEALEAAYREKGTRGLGDRDAERVEGIDVASDQQFLMVLGGPGIGKSTFLRKIGLEALKRDGAIKRECIPVFLELKKFREEALDIKQKIIEEFDTCQFPAAEAIVESALDQGKLLVLFDGLDEVPSENLDQVMEKIEDFIDKHTQNVEDRRPHNSFVASCRTAAYRRSFLRFTDVTIAEFNNSQIEDFICRWFSSSEDELLETAAEYIELLNQNDHSATKELAQTPLLLTFLCLVYDREQTLPSKRSTLYGRALNIILNEWSAQKRIRRSSIYKGFHPDLEKVMLAKIAYDSFNKDQLFFSKDTIKGHISDFLADVLDAPKSLNTEAVLEAIEVQQGILVERAMDAYSFSHLTLQEYLTALHIVKNRLEGELISQHLTDERWREIFLLVAGLMENSAPQLLGAIEQESRTYIDDSSKLKYLLGWAATNKIGDSNLSQRASMLAIASASDSAIDIDIDSTIDIASAIERVIEVGNASGSSRARARASSSASAIASAIGTDVAITIAIAIARARGRSRALARTIDLDLDLDLETVIGLARASEVEVYSDIFIDNDSDNDNDIPIDLDITIPLDRAISIANAVAKTIDLDHHFFRMTTFQSIADNLLNHKRAVPNENSLSEEWYLWSDQLWLIWLEALELDLDAITLSVEESNALKNYLYANELLIRCQQSAIYISRNQWELLEERMLTMKKI